MKSMIVYLSLAMMHCAFAEQQPPELTGTVSFNVRSRGGRIENLAVQIGDGGTGKYKAILAGDSRLPTHAIYRPRDLKPFGGKMLLPIVAFGNGGCRTGSGEFRNILSEVASHGYVVLAIGPAGDAVVGGSEGRTGQTQASQLLDGVEWISKENSREGSDYYKKIDTSKVAVMGQSCGTRQASQVSSDPRVTTTVLLNGGGEAPGSAAPATAPGSGRGAAAQTQAPGAYGNANQGTTNLFAGLETLARRYAPYAPSAMPPSVDAGTAAGRPQPPVSYHGPVAYIPGGPSDLAFTGAVAAFDNVPNVPALLAYQDVGHYPGTYREPHGGAYARAVIAWLDWQLKKDPMAKQMFAGPDCGFCKDPKWTIKSKNLN